VGSLATEDVWCLDTRGILSLSLAKDTYERLGIVGAPVGPPKRKDRFRERVFGPTHERDSLTITRLLPSGDTEST
jgi:hypothetical protein